MKSQSKQGGIYIPLCKNESSLFPLHNHPSTWSSCQDAYEYTWMNDPDRQLVGLGDMQRLKLARSSGFCPQYRCQLDDLGNADDVGNCPPGLCYSKVEFGGASFGACCFINGTFNAGRIIGYYDKLTSTPKPIYKPHRIILDMPVEAALDSYERFINAHWLDRRVMATQCAMSNTVSDTIHMILQENIDLWFQIYSETKKDCVLLHERFLADEYKDKIIVQSATATNDSLSGQHARNTKNTAKSHFHHQLSSLNLPKDRFSTNTIEFCFSNTPSRALTACASPQARKHVASFVAYTHWEDFQVPQREDHQAINSLAKAYARLTDEQHKHTLAINCYSGRGRTGSFAALVLGHQQKLASHDQLVDLIVQLRDRRDGLVETPRQYVFVSQLLGLSDPRIQTRHMGSYLENLRSDDRMIKSVDGKSKREKIDGVATRRILYSGTDISKVDGDGDKTIFASNHQNLTVHKRIDGRGCHTFVDFGTVEVLDRVDGSGDRWFINCSRVHINQRKDGAGTLYLVNSTCFIQKKNGTGKVVWAGVEPVIKKHGVTDTGDVVHDEDLRIMVDIDAI
eukprot:gene27907-33702_t